MAGTYPSFCSMKRLGVFLLPLDGMPVHRRVTPSINTIKTVLSITTCLQTSRALENYHRVNMVTFYVPPWWRHLHDHLNRWTYDGAFERLFISGGGNLNNKFQKCQMPGGLPRGNVQASICPIHYFTAFSS